MTLGVVRLQDVAPTPWRNGGGDTRELLAWPNADAWVARISVAQIAQDGPFSAYPGVQRWFSVLNGAGVLLAFGDGIERCTPASPPIAFDGAAAPGCRLIGGPTQDLNLMLRTAAGCGSVRRAIDPLHPCSLRAVYCADAMTLNTSDAPPTRLSAGTLAWSADAGARAVWQIDDGDAAAGARAWWLTFDATAVDQRPR